MNRREGFCVKKKIIAGIIAISSIFSLVPAHADDFIAEKINHDFENASIKGFTISSENDFKFVTETAKSGSFSVLTKNNVYSTKIATEVGKRYSLCVSWKETAPSEDTTLSFMADGNSIESETIKEGEWNTTTAVFVAEKALTEFKTVISSGGNYYMDDYIIEKIIPQKIGIKGPQKVLKGESVEFTPVVITESGKEFPLTEYEYKLTLTGAEFSTLNENTLSVPDNEELKDIYLNLTCEALSMSASKKVEVIDEIDSEITYEDKNGKALYNGISLNGVKSNIKVTNRASGEKNVTVAAAVYEADVLKTVLGVEEITLASGETAERSFGPYENFSKTEQLKVFVWKDMEPTAIAKVNEHTDILQEIYVATNGNDEDPGTIDKPLKTLEAARNKIRTQGVPKGGVTVYIRGGTYYRSSAFTLSSSDSGTKENPVTYKAYPGEKPVFTQGVDIPLNEADKVTDDDILSRLPDKNAKDHLYVIDLKDFGITSLTPANYPGAYTASVNNWITKLKGNNLGIPEPTISKAPTAITNEVFFDGNPMTVARYPNGDEWIYMKEGDLIDPGAFPRFWEDDYVGYGEHVPVANRDINDCFTFKYTNRVDRWVNAPDALMFGFWYHNWATQTVGIGSIDAEKNTITSDMPSYFGVRDNFRTDNFAKYYVYNLLEEIDTDGEYYFDREKTLLYFYRSDDMTDDKKITVGKGNSNFIRISNASYVTIEGLELTAGRSAGISITANNVTVKDCVIHNLASTAVSATGNNNLIDGCTIANTDGGVYISSNGSYKDGFTPGNSKVQNCTITNYARISRVYTHAITISGVENAALNNEISDAYHMAIGVSGYDNLIQGNEIYNVCRFANDAAVIYTGRNWLTRGNSVIGNYIHDIHPDPVWASTIGISAVYADDLQANMIIKGNIFENIDGYAVYFNGSYDAVVENNTFINCSQHGMAKGSCMRIGRYSGGTNNADDYILALGCVTQLNGLVSNGYFNACWADDPHSIHETKTVGGVANVDVIPVENFALFIKSDEWGQNEQANIEKYINPVWHERYPEIYQYLRYHGGDTYGNTFKNNILIDTNAAVKTGMTQERLYEEGNVVKTKDYLATDTNYRTLKYGSLDAAYNKIRVNSENMGVNGVEAADINPQGVIVNDDCTTIDGFTNYNDNCGAITTGTEDGVSYVRLSPYHKGIEETGNGTIKFTPTEARDGIKIGLGNKRIKFEKGKPITIEVRFKAKSDDNSYVLLGNNMGSTVSSDGSTAVASEMSKNHNVLAGVAYWSPYTTFVQVGKSSEGQSILDWNKQIAPNTNLLDGETWFTLTTTYDKLNNTSSSTLSWNNTSASISSTNLGYMTTKEYLEDVFLMNQNVRAEYIEVDYLKVKVSGETVFENNGTTSDWQTFSGYGYAAMFYNLRDETIVFRSDEIITIDTRFRYRSNQTLAEASEGPYMLLTLNMPEIHNKMSSYKLLTKSGEQQDYTTPTGYKSTMVAFLNGYYGYVNGYQSETKARFTKVTNSGIAPLNQFTQWIRVVARIDKLSGTATYTFYDKDNVKLGEYSATLANIPVSSYLDNIGFSQMNPDWGNITIDVDYFKVSIEKK